MEPLCDAYVMGKRRAVFLVFGCFLCLLMSGCYATLTGTVVDAETGEPIEGAVVMAEWTELKGLPGLTYTESYKVIEVLSDRDGKVTVEGVFKPGLEPPHLVVYKKGYVAWSNEYVFPEWKKRTDFEWKDGYVFRLERFREGYSYDEHVSFIYIVSRDVLSDKPHLEKAYSWEKDKAFEERKSRWTK